MEPRFLQWNGIKTPPPTMADIKPPKWHCQGCVLHWGASWLYRDSPGPRGCEVGWSTMPAFQAPSEQVSIVHLCTTLYDPMDYIQSAKLLCPWNSPGKNTGVSCHCLLQGILPTQGQNSNLCFAGRFLTIWAACLHYPVAFLHFL